MDLRQIQFFVVVAEELHFGKAAQRLHIAEQPLGYQIRKLENELGLQLFERTTRSVALTPAGISFLNDAQHLLAQANRATITAQRIAAGEAGVVRLGYESPTVVSILPGFVKLFQNSYPEIGLMLTEYSKAGLAPLKDGDTDACLITRYERLPKGFEYLPIKSDIAVVAISSDHPLALKDKLSLSDLNNETFLGYAGTSGEPANQFMSQLVDLAGSDTHIKNEAETYTALLGLVSSGLGFTIATASMNKLFTSEVSYIPLVDPEVGVDYGLALRAGECIPTENALRAVATQLAKMH